MFSQFAAQFTVFLRIPKTGSTTLKSIVLDKVAAEDRFVVSDKVYEVYGDTWRKHSNQKRWRKVYDLFREQSKGRNTYQCLVGHTWYGVHEGIDVQTQYVTLVRNPVKRFISLYNYFLDRCRKEHWISKELNKRSMTFSDFILDRDLSGHWENQQVQMISGDMSPDQSSLSKALSNIEKDFLFIGMTEHFDEEVVHLSDLLDWGFPFYKRKNTSKKHVTINHLSPDTICKVIEHNRLDIALYEYVKAGRGDRRKGRTKIFQALNRLRSTSVVQHLRQVI